MPRSDDEPLARGSITPPSRASWWVRRQARRDLDMHRYPQRAMIVRVLLITPGATVMGQGVGLFLVGVHLPALIAASVVGAIVIAATLSDFWRQTARVAGPASPAAITALRELIAPELWTSVAAMAADYCRVARDLPVTPGMIHRWLDEVIANGRRGLVASRIVAAQVQAFG